MGLKYPCLLLLATWHTVVALKIPLFNYGNTLLPFSVNPFITDVDTQNARVRV